MVEDFVTWLKQRMGDEERKNCGRASVAVDEDKGRS